MVPLARLSLFGIPVTVRPSVYAVVLVLGWASGFSTVPTMAIWVVVVLTSLIVHELGHAITARSMGSEVAVELNGLGGLTLWTSPKAGLTPGRTALIAAAGSAAGFGLAGVTWGVGEMIGPLDGLGGLAVRIVIYVNVVWGLLNWLPVRPLDGGKLFQSALAKVAPRHGEAIARVVFIATGAAALVAAFRYRMVFVGVFAAWVLLTELGLGREAAPLPELAYEGGPEAEEPVPDAETG